MTPETVDVIANGARVANEFLTVTGLGAVALKRLAAKGIDVKRLQNSSLVQAAENAAQPLVMDVLIKGQPLTDPAVLADVTLAPKALLMMTHAGIVATIGANAADMQRIARNAGGEGGAGSNRPSGAGGRLARCLNRSFTKPCAESFPP